MIPKRMLDALRVRDGNVCAFTGVESDRLVPHHRANRGHGGSRAGNTLSNLVLVDSIVNGRFEDDLAPVAREFGFKISRYAVPASIPLKHAIHGWVLLDDYGNRVCLDSV